MDGCVSSDATEFLRHTIQAVSHDYSDELLECDLEKDQPYGGDPTGYLRNYCKFHPELE